MTTSTSPSMRRSVGGCHKGQAVRYSELSHCGIGKRWPTSRADLLFASEVLRRLRGGSLPSRRELEWAGFVECWTVLVHDDLCWLTGTVWRLPLSRQVLVAPLLAIDPTAGWARAVGEWLTIEAPRLDLPVASVDPELVADSAASWLERQLRVQDYDPDQPVHS
jgi:hypothetical protein